MRLRTKLWGLDMQKSSHGFTLVEVMITIVIVAILTSIALPSYTEYVRRGRIAEAPGTMANFRVQLEQFYQDNLNYTGVGGACGVPNVLLRYFNYTCVPAAAGGQTYVLTATSNAGQGLGPVGAFTYTVTEMNTRATVRFDNVAPAVAATCWLTRRSETCS